MSTSRRARSARGCTRRACASSRSWAGPSAAGTWPSGHGNSVPRFHVTWGTGPGVIEPFVRRVRDASSAGLVALRFRHRVDGLIGHARRRRPACAATCSSRARWPRGASVSPRPPSASSTSRAGGDRRFRRHRRQPRTRARELAGAARRRRRSGCSPACRTMSTAACSAIAQPAGGRVINPDRMWHYPEGVRTSTPIWTRHGIRILPGPSSLWLDATGQRLPAPLFPGFDTLGTLTAIMPPATTTPGSSQPAHHRQGVRPVRVGAEPRPHRQAVALVPRAGPRQERRLRSRRSRPRRRLRCPRRPCPTSSPAMNALDRRAALIDHAACEREVAARDRELRQRLRQGRADRGDPRRPGLLGDQLIRIAPPHELLDPGGRSADRGTAAHADPQDARRPGDRPLRPRARRRRRPCRASTRPARRPDSAAAACTATARSKARSSAAASSPAGPPAGPPPPTSSPVASPRPISRPTLPRTPT